MTKEDKLRRARAKRLMDNYKLTLEDFEAISAHQNYVCWGCGQPEPVKGRSLANDHNHEDGLVRGHLCSRCNPVLGKLENAIARYGLRAAGITVAAWITRMAVYMTNPPAITALGRKHYGYPGRVGTKKHRKLLKKLKKMSAPK